MAQGAERRGDARALRRRAGTAGGARRLHLAQPGEHDGARPRLSRRGPRPAARHLLGRRADARLAGTGARDRRRRAAARRAHEPSRHRVAGVARADARRARRGGRARRARPLVPGGGRHRGARAVWQPAGEPARSRFFAGSWHQWRREQAARELALGKAIDAQQAEIARMERFIERFRYKATKARQAQSRVKRLEKMERIERDPAEQRASSSRSPSRTAPVA